MATVDIDDSRGCLDFFVVLFIFSISVSGWRVDVVVTESRGWKSSMRPRGKAPVWGLGTKSSETETVCRYCLHILTAETIKL